MCSSLTNVPTHPTVLCWALGDTAQPLGTVGIVVEGQDAVCLTLSLANLGEKEGGNLTVEVLKKHMKECGKKGEFQVVDYNVQAYRLMEWVDETISKSWCCVCAGRVLDCQNTTSFGGTLQVMHI